MRQFSLHVLSVSALLAMAGIAHAQDTSRARIDAAVKVTAIQTPMFSAPNVPNKVWRPRNWLEMDVDMQVKGMQSRTQKGDVLDSVEVKVFIAFNGADPTTKKYNGLSGTFNVQNMPEHGVEHSHLLAYASPALVSRMLNGKPDFTPGDIKATGVEISYNGNVVGFYSSVPGKKWWEETTVAVQPGLLLPKVKTPFAPLWGDYDLEVK